MSAVATPPRSDPGRRLWVDRNSWVTIRPIEASDADGLFAFYAALSPDARLTRFLGVSRGISKAAACGFAVVDHRTRDGLVAVLLEAGAEDGAIVGHVCMEPDGGGVDEVAVAVADRLRHRGIGTALMAEALASARRRGVNRLTASLFASNEPMRRLLLHAGPRVEAHPPEAGIVELDLDLAALAIPPGVAPHRVE